MAGTPKSAGVSRENMAGELGDASRRAYRSPSEYFGAKLTKNYAGELGTLAGEPAKDRPLLSQRYYLRYGLTRFDTLLSHLTVYMYTYAYTYIHTYI